MNKAAAESSRINMTNSGGFLTLAFGKPWYIRMGQALLRSIRLHSPKARVAVVTDQPDAWKGLADEVVDLNPAYGSGVAQKLFLDRYSPWQETLFIDSDCLVFRNIEQEMWPAYRTGRGFGVMGSRYLHSGDSHYSLSDLSSVLDSLGLSRMPSFNGGVYYYNRTAEAEEVFEAARSMYADRDRLGLYPFKNSPVADEPLFGLAMERVGIPLIANAHLMVPTQGRLEGLRKLDVMNGRSKFVKNGIEREPAVIHFNYDAQKYYAYRREMRKLESSILPGLRAGAEIVIALGQDYVDKIVNRLRQK